MENDVSISNIHPFADTFQKDIIISEEPEKNSAEIKSKEQNSVLMTIPLDPSNVITKDHHLVSELEPERSAENLEKINTPNISTASRDQKQDVRSMQKHTVEVHISTTKSKQEKQLDRQFNKEKRQIFTSVSQKTSYNVIEPMSENYGCGIIFSSISHIVEFLKLNRENQDFLKLVRRLLCGTIGSKHEREQEILYHNGFLKHKVNFDDAEYVQMRDEICFRLEKVSRQHFEVLCHLFNVDFCKPLAAVYEELISFLIYPRHIENPLVKPYLISINDSQHQPRKHKSIGEVIEEPAKKSGRRGRPKKNIIDDASSSENEYESASDELAHDSASIQPSASLNSEMKSKFSHKQQIECVVAISNPAVESSSAVPAKRRGRPPKSAKVQNDDSSSIGQKEKDVHDKYLTKTHRSAPIIHQVE